ncbi:amino acid adenylation domain-containing protein [Brevibacterium luteolum]|uniref:Amino acid adenylation domain-containing protein n=1 Tax=Brevibacterium luteolum TaxID=199591 RepID=A0A6G8KZ14_9MICO|nr:amino acid adenylation domain-containing protein [Brevibacterium luteolum]QIN29863.1 amino acid adenylation domain-containing protein [Brevibacterium luteolum]
MNAAPSAASVLADRFLKEIATRGEAIAIVDDERQVTFGKLGQMVGATQQHLEHVKTATVGIYSVPSTTLVTAAWAALCSGIPYVPLSPTYPDERLRYMVCNSEIDTILAPAALHDDIRAIIGDLSINVIDVPTIDSSAYPKNSAHVDDIAYILYTSGSTGTPKGVKVDHQALAHQMAWLAQALDVSHSARVVHKTPISFDASQWELLATGNGATTVVAAPEAYRDPDSMVTTIQTHGVTHLQAVPTLLQALCEDESFAECTSLQVVASGGEVLTRRLAENLRALVPGARIVNLYGPTEATINASHHVYSPTTDLSGGEEQAVPIGRPVPGMDFFLLDDQGTVTSEDAGELAIVGPQLAVGYHRLPNETQQRFVRLFVRGALVRAYRTGDLVERVGEEFYFRGRTDSQVKIRGHRIELGEVRSSIANHDWVRHAEVLATYDVHGTATGMTAFVELNPYEAALMDQGVHGAHHQSKSNRVQVKAQVAGLGIREESQGKPVELPVSEDDHQRLHQLAFARKTYRYFRSTTADMSQLSKLRDLVAQPREWEQGTNKASPLKSLAVILRSLVQYTSDDRLLPKYAYASPGALYGVQVYVATTGFDGLEGGVYYLNPRTATLHRSPGTSAADASLGVQLILIGQRSVISSVYQTNVDEVLLFEAGHLLGTVDTVAPAAGYRLGDYAQGETLAAALISNAEREDRFVIGCWPLVNAGARSADPLNDVTTRLELYAGDSELRGIYEWDSDGIHRVSSGPIVRRKDVIAINQRVYNQASFGLMFTANGTKNSYISLGRALQRVQLNDLGLGLMSSGYSSFSGHDLPTARRVKAFTGTAEQSSYFALGGPVTAEQIAHTGMNEDLLHAQGPAEIIATDLAEHLPHYMIPETIRILDELPKTPNGKIDAQALRETAELQTPNDEERTYTAPGSLLEHRLSQIWRDILGREEPVSVTARFFSVGGNSISAVRLVRAIRNRLGVNLPIQSVFEQDTIAKQASVVQRGVSEEFSRIVPLAGSGNSPVYLWPGLGGYPMNLRHLAERISTDERRCYGIQAFGLNEDESIDESIQSMAARDVAQIRRLTPDGPYTLVGYSFGARVAFEAAYQLERDGGQVDQVVLIAPGSPSVTDTGVDAARSGLYADPRFVRVLYSVFFSRTDGPDADRVVNETSDRLSFLSAIRESLPIDEVLAERITSLVEHTYSFEYSFTELEQRALSAPVTIIRAAGDDYSFLDSVASKVRYDSIELSADHYAVLQPPHVDITAETVHAALTGAARVQDRKHRPRSPHIAVKSFPPGCPESKRKEFLSKLALLVSKTFDVSDTEVSISLDSSDRFMEDTPFGHERVSRDHMVFAGSTSGGDQ